MRRLLDRLTGSALASLEPAFDFERALWVLAVALFYIGSILIALNAGSARTAEIAYDAFAREAHYKSLTAALVDRCTIAMHLVLEEDIYLHARIRSEVPDWNRLVAIARASVEDGP